MSGTIIAVLSLVGNPMKQTYLATIFAVMIFSFAACTADHSTDVETSTGSDTNTSSDDSTNTANSSESTDSPSTTTESSTESETDTVSTGFTETAVDFTTDLSAASPTETETGATSVSAISTATSSATSTGSVLALPRFRTATRTGRLSRTSKTSATESATTTETDTTIDTATATESATTTTTNTASDEMSLLTDEDLAACAEDASLAACQACPDKLYGQKIYYDGALSADFAAWAVDEFATLLNNASSANFSVAKDEDTTTAEPAIFLLKPDAARVTASTSTVLQEKITVMQQSVNEAFVVHVENGQLWLIAPREKDLRHAAYAYLKQLGYRFYGMNEIWTVTPTVSAICLAETTVIKESAFASFQLSGYFGSSIAAIDYLGKVDASGETARSLLWKDRVMLPKRHDYSSGHAQHAFVYDTGVAGFASKIDPTKTDPLYFSEFSDARRIYDAKTITGSAKLHYTHHGSLSCDDPKATVVYTDESGTKYCEDITDYKTDAGVTQMFSDWAVDILGEKIADETTNTLGYYNGVSVEPYDGNWECQCDKCTNLLRNGPYGSTDVDSIVSDRVFHLANITAKKVAAKFGEDRNVNLLAYAYHSMVPSIPLEQNMFVDVMPTYANYSIYEGDDLIEAWIEKSNNNPAGGFDVGVSEYYCLPMWQQEVHYQECDWKNLGERVPEWARMKLSSVKIDGSLGQAMAGPTLDQFANQAWNPDINTEEVLDEFFEKSFGVAKIPVEDFYADMNSFDVTLSQFDVSSLCNKMLEADAYWQASDKDEKIGARLNELKKYAHFLQLTHDRRATYDDLENQDKTNPDYTADVKALDNLTEWIYRIADTDIIMSIALAETYYKAYFTKERYYTTDLGYVVSLDAYTQLWAKWKTSDATALGWARLKAFPELTTDALNTLMTDCSNKLSGENIEKKTYSSEYIALYPNETDTTLLTTHSNRESDDFKIVVAGPRTETLTVSYNNGYKVGSSKTSYTLSDSSGNVLYTKTLYSPVTTWTSDSLVLEFPAAGNYTLSVEATDFGSFTISAPKNLPFTTVTPLFELPFPVSTTKYYFFVPKGIDAVYFELDLSSTNPASGVTFTKPDGTTTGVTLLSNNLYKVETGGLDGVWSFSGMRTTYDGMHFINVPQVISYSKETLVVPANAVAQDTDQ